MWPHLIDLRDEQVDAEMIKGTIKTTQTNINPRLSVHFRAKDVICVDSERFLLMVNYSFHV